jgi:hypothetical protein
MSTRTIGPGLVLGTPLLVIFSAGAMALDVPKGEKKALEACERRFCDIVARKGASGPDYGCSISKTWAKADLKQGSASGKIKWGFGDARCSVDLEVARGLIAAAMGQDKAMVQLPEHQVTCIVERDKGPANVRATLAPKAQFEGGQLKKVWINLKKVEGPTMIKGLAYAAARLEDSVGVFHRPLVKAINRLVHEKCPTLVAKQ